MSSEHHWEVVNVKVRPYHHCLLFQIKVCDTCQHTERSKNLARTVRPIKVDAPWDIVGIDIIGFCLNSFHQVIYVFLLYKFFPTF